MSNNQFIDITGQKFGIWIVIKKVKVPNITRAMFFCKCECGTEEIISGKRLRKGKTKSCGCNKRKKTKEERFKTTMFAIYKRRSKYKKFGFNLTKKEILELSEQNCYYCGKKPNNFYTVHEDTFYYSGLDRINNNIGYISTNVVPCCKQCNQAKSNLTQKQFEDHVLKIAKHLNIL